MIKNRTYSLVILFFFIGIFSYAQSISGKMSDKEETAIQYAEVIVTKGNIRKTTISDEKGNFILRLPENGNYFFEVLQNGNRVYSNSIVINGDTVKNVYLPNINETTVQEVVITKKVVQQIGDKTYFNVENSVLAKGNTGLEILQKSPKLVVNSEGNVLLKNRNVAVLINGRKTNLSGNDLNSYLQSLSSEEVKRIEIQDVASSDQDASETGGVVNIVLKKNPKGFRVIAKTYYLFRKENYDSNSGGLNLNYGTEKWNIYSDISYTENRDYGKSTGTFNYNNGQRNVNEEIFKQYNDNLGVRLGSVFYPNEKNTIGIEGYYNKNKIIFDSEGNLGILNGNTPIVNSKSYSLSKTPSDLWYITINYTLKIDDIGSTVKFIGDVGTNNRRPFNNVSSEYATNPLQNSHYLYNTNSVSKYYTSQIDWIQKFEDNWELNAGIKFGSVKRDNLLDVNYLNNEQWEEDFNQKQDFDNRENILAGYTSLSKAFGNHFLKVGLRTEDTNVKGYNQLNDEEVKQNYTRLFPSLYYKYNLNNEKNLSFNYRRSISRPSFRDLNPFVVKQNDYLYEIGNPNLKPEYKDLIEIGLVLKRHNLSLSGSKTQNTIQGNYYTNQDINYYQSLNLGEEYQVSLHYSYSGNINKWLFVNVSSGMFRNMFKYDNMKINGSSAYNNIYGQMKISESLIFEIFNNFSTPFTYRNVKNALWYRMDLAIQKSFMDKQVLIKLRLNDMFNTVRDKNTTIQNNFSFDYYQKRPSRNILLYVQYTFNNNRKAKSGTVNSANESRNRF